jgi:hypothetical protein
VLIVIYGALVFAFPKVASAFEVIVDALPILALATYVYAMARLYRQGVHRQDPLKAPRGHKA